LTGSELLEQRNTLDVWQEIYPKMKANGTSRQGLQQDLGFSLNKKRVSTIEISRKIREEDVDLSHGKKRSCWGWLCVISLQDSSGK
jgi:hypothetical protein